jgi:hypothetical protein
MSTARRRNLPPGNKPQSPIFPLNAQVINIVVARLNTLTRLKSGTNPSIYANVKGGTGHTNVSIQKHTLWTGSTTTDEKLLELRDRDICFTLRSQENKRYITTQGSTAKVALPVYAQGHVLRVPDGITMLTGDTEERRALDDLVCIRQELNEINFECFATAPDSRADTGGGHTIGHRAGLFTVTNNSNKDIPGGWAIRVRCPRPYEVPAGHSWPDAQSGYRPTLWLEAVDPKRLDFTYLPYIASIFRAGATEYKDNGIFEKLRGALSNVGSEIHTISANYVFWQNDALLTLTNPQNFNKPFFSDRYEIIWYNILVGMIITMNIRNADLRTPGRMRDAFNDGIEVIQTHLMAPDNHPDEDGYVYGLQRTLQSLRQLIGNHDRNIVARSLNSALQGNELDIFVAGAGR